MSLEIIVASLVMPIGDSPFLTLMIDSYSNMV